MNKLERTACIAMALSIASFAHAAEVVPLSLAGTSHSVDLDADDVNTSEGTYAALGYGIAKARASSVDSDSKAYRFTAGYAAGKYIFAEMNYLVIDFDRPGSYAGNLYGGSLGGRLPIGDYFSVAAKLGVAIHKGSARSANSSNGSSFAYGVIAAVDFNRHFGLRVEYEGLGTGLGTYDVFTGSLIWKQ